MNKEELFLSENLKKTKKLEGGLFACITLSYCGRDFVARKDLYTVQNGIVYAVLKDGTLYETEDILWHVERDCHRIGTYNPNKKYKTTAKTFSYSEIKKILKL